MSIRLRIASLIFMMINAVVFGIGLVSVLLVPALAERAFAMIPTVVIASFLISAPLAWFIAPTLRSRFVREHVPQVEPVHH
jgi:hypothetical protein